MSRPTSGGTLGILAGGGEVPLRVARTAMAAGRPVIAYRAGGALETVVENQTGVFFDRQDAQSLMECVSSFDPGRFNPEEARQQALRFDVEVFKGRIKSYVDEAWKRFSDNPATLTNVGHLTSVPAPDTKTEGEHGATTDEKRVV